MLWRAIATRPNAKCIPASGVLILIGDLVHNFVDGILIAATFLTSVPLGKFSASCEREPASNYETRISTLRPSWSGGGDRGASSCS